MSDTYSSEDTYQPPEGFGLEPPKPKLPQGFQLAGDGAPPQQAVDQTDWSTMLNQLTQTAATKPRGNVPLPRPDPRQDYGPPPDDDAEDRQSEADAKRPVGAPTMQGTRPPIPPEEMMENRGVGLPRSPDDEDLDFDPMEKKPDGGWMDQLNELIGLKPAKAESEPPGAGYQVEKQPTEPGAFQKMLDMAIPPAEARGARKPSTHAPPTPTEGGPPDGRIGTVREDGKMWDGEKWTEERYQPGVRERVRPDQAPEKPGGQSTWGEMRRRATEAVKQTPNIWTNLHQDYENVVRENWDTMTEGLANLSGQAEKGRLGRAGQVGYGLWNTTIGGLMYATSPVQAIARWGVAKPVEAATGMPRQFTEYATMLATPGIGMARFPEARLPGQPPAAAPLRAAASVEKMLSPETVGPSGEDMAASIRMATGTAVRNTEQWAAKFDEDFKAVEKLPQAEKWNIQNWIDGGAGARAPAPEFAQAAQNLKDAFADVQTRFSQLPKYMQQEWREQYFPHMWKDPNNAFDLLGSKYEGVGKKGSGASLTPRTIPTFEDGIKAGLVPKYDNPLEAGMRYVSSMNQFFTRHQVLQDGIDQGTIITAEGRMVGASGRGGNVEVGVPAGYVKINGTDRAGGEALYAPETAARVYNNWQSQGAHAWQESGELYDTINRVANAGKQSLLSLSGFHGFTMAEASMSTEVARALAKGSNMRAADIFKMLGSPAAPVNYLLKGRRARDVYLDPLKGTPEERQVIDLLTEGGGRFTGAGHAKDFEMSAMGNFFKSMQRGTLMREFQEQGRMIGQSYQAGQGFGGVRAAGSMASVAMENIGRVAQSIQAPLFEYTIPRLKAGASYHMMADWLKENPSAGHTAQMAAARRIVDHIDNRFGEMIQDNIFWTKGLKQAATMAMLSYSWNMGGWREIGGGVRDISRMAVGQGGWTPKAAYTVGTAMVWSGLSLGYQYMMGGGAPGTVNPKIAGDQATPIQDLMAPRTGGIVSVPRVTGIKGGRPTMEWVDVPERVIPPGIMKDVFGYYEHPVGELINKLSPVLKEGWQLVQGEDWKQDPIFKPMSPEADALKERMPTWLGNAMDFIARTNQPISTQAMSKEYDPRSNIPPWQRGLGFREAPRFMYDPYLHERDKAFATPKYEKQFKAEERRKKRLKSYGGTSQ